MLPYGNSSKAMDGQAVTGWHVSMPSKTSAYAVVEQCDPGSSPGCHMARCRLSLLSDNLVIECVDHINHDCLDNRRSNLRLATFTQNGMNRIINTGKKSSQYKGVHWHKRVKQWEARITIFGNRKHIGYFRTEVGAARAYDENAKANFGDFARVNFR